MCECTRTSVSCKCILTFMLRICTVTYFWLSFLFSAINPSLGYEIDGPSNGIMKRRKQCLYLLCKFAVWWDVPSWLEAFLQTAKSNKLSLSQSWNFNLLKCVPQLQFGDKINYGEICTNVFWELATFWVKYSVLSLMVDFSDKKELGGNQKKLPIFGKIF